MGVLDKIDFSYQPSPTASMDYRLLDAPCDHLIRNEEATNFDLSLLKSGVVYSGISSIYNNRSYSDVIDPDASTIGTTALPYTNDGSFIMYEKIIVSDVEIVQNMTVVDIVNYVDLYFPPLTNTVRAKQKVYINSTDYKLIDFTRYSLAQLYGKIIFTDANDIGEEIIFYYLPDKRPILQQNKDTTPNYEFIGLNSKGCGIFKVYGRALKSNNSKLLLRYKTKKANCTKCEGTNEVNDIIFDENGRIQEVYDFSKLIQDFFKRLLTDKGSNSFDTNEGTELHLIMGIGKRNPELIDTMIKNQIVFLLNDIRAKQALQSDLQGISLAEQIYQINNVFVRSINATDMQVEVEVLSRTGQTQQIKAVVQRG